MGSKATSTSTFDLIFALRHKMRAEMRELFLQIFILRSKAIDKFAYAKYNIYIIKQNKCLIKSNGKEDSHLGKGKKKRQKEKELLEQRQIKFQIYESLAAIIATIVTMLLAIITAVLSWID